MLRPTFALLFTAFVAGCASDAPPPELAAPASAQADFVLDRPGAAFPTVADGEGSVLLAWAEDGAAFVTRVDDASSAPVRASSGTDDVVAHGQAPVQVVTGPGGEVYVVYVAQTPIEGRRFPASELRVARSTDGGRTFEPAVTANDAVGFPTGHHFHDVAVGPDGTVYVSWLDSRENDRPTAATSPHGGSPVHHAHATHDAGSGTQVRVARSTDGGRSFEPSAVVAEHTCQCCRTALAVGPEGAVYVAWRHLFGQNVRDMAVARSDDRGHTFGSPVRVHADGWQIDGCPHAGPALAVDDAGRLHVAWYTGAEAHRGILYAASTDGGRTFAAPRSLTRNGPIAQVSAGTDGESTWIAWENPAEGTVQVARVGPDRDTPEPQTTLGDRATPSLAVGGDRWVLAGRQGDRLLIETGPVAR